MTKLRGLPAPPASVSRKAGPHNYRVLGGRVLLANDFGGRAFLSPEEYDEFLAGRIGAAHARRRELAEAGLLAEEFSLAAAAARVRSRGLLSWAGPERHVLLLDARGAAMPPETARRIVDFVFAGPAGPLRLELAAQDLEAAWPAAWFSVQYARRKSDWYGRPIDMILRVGNEVSAARREFLTGHGAALRVLARAGAESARSVIRGREALCLVGDKAAQPEGWADLFVGAGFESVRLCPAEDFGAAQVAGFARFYAKALDRLLWHARSGAQLREEWAAEALCGRRAALRGADVVSELAYAPDGAIFTSEAAAREGEALFALGSSAELEYKDLAAADAARACVAAACPENQPLCAVCAYKPFCALSPSRSQKAQGTLWGRTPENLDCSLQMALLDVLFERLADPESASVLEGWAG